MRRNYDAPGDIKNPFSAGRTEDVSRCKRPGLPAGEGTRWEIATSRRRDLISHFSVDDDYYGTSNGRVPHSAG